MDLTTVPDGALALALAVLEKRAALGRPLPDDAEWDGPVREEIARRNAARTS